MDNLKEKYQKYKTLYETNSRELTTYSTRVSDACDRINESIRQLKSISNLTGDAQVIKNKIDSIPECNEDNVNEVSVLVKQCYTDLEIYCNRLINDVMG